MCSWINFALVIGVAIAAKMGILIGIIWIASVCAGVFLFSWIIFPILYAWNWLGLLYKLNLLERPVPVKDIISGPILWSIILTLITLIVIKTTSINYSIVYACGLCWALLWAIGHVMAKNQDLAVGLVEGWGNYMYKDDLSRQEIAFILGNHACVYCGNIANISYPSILDGFICEQCSQELFRPRRLS